MNKLDEKKPEGNYVYKTEYDLLEYQFKKKNIPILIF